MSSRRWTRRCRRLAAIIALTGFAALGGCSPKVGSDAWCEKLRNTPKIDWSTREAADFAKHCIFK